jgi:hypothetical protein
MANNKSRFSNTGRSARDRVQEISFEDDGPPARIGDERRIFDHDSELPPRRVRAAGMTGGEAQPLGQDVTADDLSPETLLDEEGAESPSAYAIDDETPADKTLHVVGSEEIGGGNGKDEAELARE